MRCCLTGQTNTKTNECFIIVIRLLLQYNFYSTALCVNVILASLSHPSHQASIQILFSPLKLGIYGILLYWAYLATITPQSSTLKGLKTNLRQLSQLSRDDGKIFFW